MLKTYQTSLPSPAGPWGSPGSLDTCTVSRAGGRDEVAMSFPDPTYVREEIEANPVWRRAFELSELRNDTAPIGWSHFIAEAEAELAPQEPAPGSPAARPAPEAVAQAAETIRDLDQYYFASAINGNTVRVFRDARTCEPYFDDRYELKLSRVQGAEILRLAQQQYELADALEAARNTIRSLADQQAMPDDSWRVVDEQIESALRKAGRA
jgi:hypothetical protein